VLLHLQGRLAPGGHLHGEFGAQYAKFLGHNSWDWCWCVFLLLPSTKLFARGGWCHDVDLEMGHGP
jgi:hypothetical protein